MNDLEFRRRVASEDVGILADALTLGSSEETRILATREHIWALRAYYESVFKALKETVEEQHGVIREVARR